MSQLMYLFIYEYAQEIDDARADEIKFFRDHHEYSGLVAVGMRTVVCCSVLHCVAICRSAADVRAVVCCSVL